MSLFGKFKSRKSAGESQKTSAEATENKETVTPEHEAPDPQFRIADDSPVYQLRRRYPEYTRGRKSDLFEFMYDSIRKAHDELRENYIRLNGSPEGFDIFDDYQRDLLVFAESINKCSALMLKSVSGNQSGRGPASEPAEAVILTGQSRDGINAWIFVIPPVYGAEKLTPADITDKLESDGIVYGVDEEFPERVIREELYFKVLPAATGRYPVNGINGGPKEPFARDSADGGETVSDDRSRLGIIKSVRAGDLIAEIIPPVPAVDGIKVTGEPAGGTDGVMPEGLAGKNTVISDDGLTITAAADGELYFSGGEFRVSRLTRISGDIEASPEAAEYEGDLAVFGSIKEGACIKCEGSIRIFGNAGAAEITAGGDIRIEQGMTGAMTGTLRAGGSIECRFLENCNAEAGADIISDQILNCIVTAGGVVSASGGRGRIIGGKIYGEHGIKTQYIGGSYGTASHTVLSVGSYSRYKKQIAENNRLIRENEAEIKKLNEQLMNFHRMRNSLNSVQKSVAARLLEQLNAFNQKNERIQADIEELEELCKEPAENTEIICDRLRAAVDIEYNGKKGTIDQKLDNFKVFTRGNKIIASAAGNFERVISGR